MSVSNESESIEKIESAVEPDKNSNETVSVDPLLRYLCYLAIVFRLQIPLTLQVGGLTVSGILIDRRKYNNGMNRLLRNVDENSGPEEMKELFREIADNLFPITDSTAPPDQEKEELSIDQVNFIHLKDARIVNANGSIPTGGQGLYWRGALSAVDGFCWGTISVNPE